jgi:hypothetical protein
MTPAEIRRQAAELEEQFGEDLEPRARPAAEVSKVVAWAAVIFGGGYFLWHLSDWSLRGFVVMR